MIGCEMMRLETDYETFRFQPHKRAFDLMKARGGHKGEASYRSGLTAGINNVSFYVKHGAVSGQLDRRLGSWKALCSHLAAGLESDGIDQERQGRRL